MRSSASLSRRAAIGALALLAAPLLHAQGAAPPELQAALPGARLQGSGRLRFLGFRVYDIRLWTATPVAAAGVASLPLALEIEYLRSLVGRQIAERSLVEMRRQAAIPDAQADRWLAQLTALIPDVKEGDRLTGVQLPGEATQLFFNGSLKGEVRDADFTRLFFGIWLSPRSSEPALRDALLGPLRSPT